MTSVPGSHRDPPSRLRFGCFEMDLDQKSLTRKGRPCRIQQKAFDLLVILALRPGRLVSREDLVARLWPDTVVDFEHGLNTLMRKVRTALGDSAAKPVYVETVPRRGYRFLGAVEAGDPPVVEACSGKPPVTHPWRSLRPRLAWIPPALALVFSFGSVSHQGTLAVSEGQPRGLHAELSKLLEQVQPCAWCREHFSESGRLYDCPWCLEQLEVRD